MTMHPDSRASRCLAILREGPATTAEVAAETGWGVHLTCAHLTNLFQRGKVQKQPFRPLRGRACMLWSVRAPRTTS